MSAALQNVLVALIAAGALAWLIVRRVRARRRGNDGACESCPASVAVPGTRPAPMPEVLLSIGDPAENRGEPTPFK